MHQTLWLSATCMENMWITYVRSNDLQQLYEPPEPNNLAAYLHRCEKVVNFCNLYLDNINDTHVWVFEELMQRCLCCKIAVAEYDFDRHPSMCFPQFTPYIQIQIAHAIQMVCALPSGLSIRRLKVKRLLNGNMGRQRTCTRNRKPDAVDHQWRCGS
jgi:hypothetical protein